MYPKKGTEKSVLLIKDPSGGLQLAADLFVTLPLGVWWRSLEDPDGGVDLAAARVVDSDAGAFEG